ncbi:FDLD family class I lanthipeptide [Streptomyces sp. NPDC054887]
MSDAFDLDARISAPVAGPAGEQAPPPSISTIATRTVCTRVGCSVTKTCACTSMCTILCVGPK